MTYQKYITYFFIITVFAMQPLVCLFNYSTDYSYQWSDYEPIAKQSLHGKNIEIPANYNEREYQHQIIKHLSKIPDIIVIGSYNPSPFNLQDENFIDFMHIDRNSIKGIWQPQTVW